MIEFELSRIIIDEAKKEQVIVLKEKKGVKFLPIVVGSSEAASIRMPLNGFKPTRPLTHDLVCSIVNILNAKLEKVVIDGLVEDTFHAKLYLMTNAGIKIIDTRPSDGIALAVRMKSPLYIEEDIFNKLSEKV